MRGRSHRSGSARGLLGRRKEPEQITVPMFRTGLKFGEPNVRWTDCAIWYPKFPAQERVTRSCHNARDPLATQLRQATCLQADVILRSGSAASGLAYQLPRNPQPGFRDVIEHGLDGRRF
jgi:hypothetical protein